MCGLYATEPRGVQNHWMIKVSQLSDFGQLPFLESGILVCEMNVKKRRSFVVFLGVIKTL